MNNNFEVITDNSIWKDKFSMEDIDYSILLAKVFGKPVETANAFMYLFRRYGYTNRGSDDYKELCSYAFHTNNDDVIVRWGLGYPGTYQYHLCAFVNNKDRFEWEEERRKPFKEWNDRMVTWAKEKHGYLLYSMYDLYKSDEEEKILTFIGTPEQKEDIENTMDANNITTNDDEAFLAIQSIKEKQRSSCWDEYKLIEPLPENNSNPSFSERHANPIEAAEKQHQWILSFDENNLIRKTYFAAMALFEDWKKPTYIRDAYFNLAGEDENTYPTIEIDGETTMDTAEYSHHAGHGIPFGMFEGDNFNKVQEYIDALNSANIEES